MNILKVMTVMNILQVMEVNHIIQAMHIISTVGFRYVTSNTYSTGYEDCLCPEVMQAMIILTSHGDHTNVMEREYRKFYCFLFYLQQAGIHRISRAERINLVGWQDDRH